MDGSNTFCLVTSWKKNRFSSWQASQKHKNNGGSCLLKTCESRPHELNTCVRFSFWWSAVKNTKNFSGFAWIVWCCSVISVERPVTDAITRSLVPQSVSFKKEVHRKKVGHSGSPVCFVVVQFVHHKRGKSKCGATKMNKQSRMKGRH